MAVIKMYKAKLAHNYQQLDLLFKKHHKDWSVVTKLLCGNELFLNEVLKLNPKEVCDSRIQNLKKIKKLNPDIQTVYIKPPSKRSIKNVVRYADVSFNTESETVHLLSEEAGRQGKIHRVTIMIELGDLREGIMGDHLIDFYQKIFELPHIEVVAIGTNLTCLNGILPSQDKLIQLSLYKQLVEAKFSKQIPWVTAGTSVVIPLLSRKQVPSAVNHFRVGESLFFGVNLLSHKLLKGLKKDIFKLYAEIIEITEKPKVPIGPLGINVAGEVTEIKEDDYGKSSYRAILDVGLLEISPEHLTPDDKKLEVINASSDMLIVDLGERGTQYKIGDRLSFGLTYMGVLSLLNSNYVEKQIA